MFFEVLLSANTKKLIIITSLLPVETWYENLMNLQNQLGNTPLFRFINTL